MHTTPLHHLHQQLNAKLFHFHEWDMPLHYGSQIQEHLAVRQHAGIFDVSHMGVIDIKGADSTAYLRYLLANDVNRLTADNAALYSCLLNHDGGVIDDLIVYRLTLNHYRLIVNASNRDKDLTWLKQHRSDFNTIDINPQPDLCILAIQGPASIKTVSAIINSDLSTLKRFSCTTENQFFIGRTGYTGEDGVEIIAPAQHAIALWNNCIEQQVQPCGLGARDSLRLEAGLNLYGNDMDDHIHPYSANLGWTVCLKDPQRDFIGKTPLEIVRQQANYPKLIGVILTEPGVLRNQQPIKSDSGNTGIITSGGFSPVLKQAIGLARLPADTAYHNLYIQRRDKKIPLKQVTPPFYTQQPTQ